MCNQMRFAGGIIARMCRLVILWVAVTTGFGQTLDHSDFSTITLSRQAYAPFRVFITAKSSTATVRTYTGTMQFNANDVAGPLAAEALSTLKFSSGEWVCHAQ
jgi:hypothetical protein